MQARNIKVNGIDSSQSIKCEILKKQCDKLSIVKFINFQLLVHYVAINGSFSRHF